LKFIATESAASVGGGAAALAAVVEVAGTAESTDGIGAADAGA